MRSNFYGSTLADLFNWSNTFSTVLNATPAAFFITPAVATQYAGLNTAWAALYQSSLKADTRTRTLLAQRNAARAQLLALAKNLVATIGTNPAITDAQRTSLGIPIRKRPTPQPVPDSSPVIEVVSLVGRTVTLLLKAAGSGGKRGKPPFVAGASLFSHVGETAPLEIEAWKFEANITKTTVELPFGPSPTASTVWVTAFWYNGRANAGIACPPVRINLPAAGVVPQSADMKLAA